MNWNKYILLWNQAAVRVVDIRYHVLGRGPELDYHSYLLPSSAFIFPSRGSASVRLDGEPYTICRYHVLHVGKGSSLEITTKTEEFAYYLILYKALLPFPVNPALQRLGEERGPFRELYHVIPQEPLPLYEKIQRMAQLWQQEQALDHLRVKSLFYEFVHELLRQLSVNDSAGNNPDPVTQTIRYIHAHYEEAITLEDLAERLGCSVSYMSRIFKAQVGTSPNDYLIQVRMEQAKRWLTSSDIGLYDIALSVGYSDVYYFSRLFKKQAGVSPVQFRNKMRKMQGLQHNPWPGSKLSIVPENPFLYIDNENQYYEKGEVQYTMFRNTKPSLAAVMLLCLTLLISACGGGNVVNDASNAGSQNAVNTQTQQVSSNQKTDPAKDGKQSSGTRTFKHLYGETEIPTHPQRILTAFHVGQPMALGVRPLGSSTYILQNPALNTEGMEDLGVPLNLEKMNELEPDLIILVDAYVEMSGGYEAFTKIGPTIVIEPYYDPVKDILLMGDILGKEAEAQRWVAEFEDKVAAAKAQVTEVVDPNQTFTIISVFEKSIRIYRDQNMSGNILYKYLGLKPHEKVLNEVINNKESTAPYIEVSAEVVSDFIGDNLLVATNESNKEAFEQLKNTGIWANLAPVKNNKVYMLDYDLFLQSDPIAVTDQLKLITEQLIDRNK